ncbi:putative ribonuclease H domain-containing protein [Arabidopsis thaliana]
MPNEEESINHALFTCPSAHRIWRLLNALLLANHSFTNDSEESITFLVDNFSNKNLSEEERLIPFWIIWRIWKARNKFVFEKYSQCPLKLVSQSTEEVKEWTRTRRSSRSTQVVTPSHPSPKRWTKPTSSYVKINFDASFHINNTASSGGWVIRDHEGSAKAWGSSTLEHVNTPLEAETKALLVAMQQTWIRGYRRVHFEGDCEVLINTINGRRSRSDIANLLHDIDFWASKFSSLVFTFTSRQCNILAHHLASPLYSSCVFQSDSGIQPMWLKKLLCNYLLP